MGIASTGEELLQRLDECRPQVVLQDLLLPGGMDGIETTQRVLARELDVLRQVALGRSNKDIAAILDISEETVTTHVRHVLA